MDQFYIAISCNGYLWAKGSCLDRAEAIVVLKETASACAIRVSSINLVSPKVDDTLSKGYQIHIKSQIDESDRRCLESIVNLHQLTMNVVDDYIII